MLLLLALPIRAQTTTTPAPLLRFFAVPWVEQLQSWHTARSNAAFAFRRGTARGHSGGGLAVEMMPSPNVA
ncbi:MAG: hypothetical protein H7330_03795, partial [Hymenobacteraceae bacterium]|nr:hypothetical protein [Hymenobacteraceae bacterium]